MVDEQANGDRQRPGSSETSSATGKHLEGNAENSLRLSQRQLVAVFGLCAGSLLIASVDRISISVAAIAMQQTFEWSDTTKGTVLAAFFGGYVLTQVAGGWLAFRYGGERVLTISLIAWSLCTLAMPWAAHSGLSVLLAMRFLLGVFEGPCTPAAYSILGRWMPESSRATAISSFGSAGFLGCFVALLVTGPIVLHYSWEASFVMFGVLGLVFAAAYLPLTRKLDRAGRQARSVSRHLAKSESSRIPWRRLLSLGAFWALVFSFFCTAWVYYVMMLWMPSYFERVHHLNIAESGFLSLAPWIIMFIVMNVAGLLAARLVRSGQTTTQTRKLLVVGGLTGTSGSLIAVLFAASPIAAMALLCVALASLAMSYAGLAPNVFDIAPRYGEVLFAVLNTFGALPGIIGVALTGWMVQVSGSFDSALIAAAVLALLGALVFLSRGTARQLIE